MVVCLLVPASALAQEDGVNQSPGGSATTQVIDQDTTGNTVGDVTQDQDNTQTNNQDCEAVACQQVNQQANCQVGVGNCGINQAVDQRQTVVQGGAAPTAAPTAAPVVRGAAVQRPVAVRRVALARTGFDAWLPVGVGVLLLGGGIALLTTRRLGGRL